MDAPRMINPDLAALSAAATQGEWAVDGPPHNRIVWSSPDDRVCFMAHSNGKDISRDMATPAFIAALVNAYRTGNLVQIDREGMRETARQAVRERWLQLPCSADDLADAAIAAILGGQG